MSSETLSALIGAATTLIGVGLGACLSRRAARELLEDQARQEFALAFTDTLLRLANGVEVPGEGEASHILDADFPRHHAAYMRLRTLLRSEGQAALDKAWSVYAPDDQYETRQVANTLRFAGVLSANTDDEHFKAATDRVNELLRNVRAPQSWRKAMFSGRSR